MTNVFTTYFQGYKSYILLPKGYFKINVEKNRLIKIFFRGIKVLVKHFFWMKIYFFLLKTNFWREKYFEEN